MKLLRWLCLLPALVQAQIYYNQTTIPPSTSASNQVSSDVNNTGGWGSTKGIAWANQSGWTLPTSAFLWQGSFGGNCLTTIICSAEALITSNDNVVMQNNTGQDALLTVINQVGTTGTGQKEAAYFQMKVNSNIPDNPNGAYEAAQFNAFSTKADVTSAANVVVNGSASTSVTSTSCAMSYTGGTYGASLLNNAVLTVTGTNTGGGAINGYASPTDYVVGSANPGGGTFNLLKRDGTALSGCTVGTLVGLTFTMEAVGVWGQDSIATLNNGATGYFNVTGAEYDVGINTGASALKVIGMQVVGDTNSAVSGTEQNSGYTLAAISGFAGFDSGFTFGGAESFNPMKSTGIAFCFWPHGALSCGNGSGSFGTIGSVLDASNVTISNYFLRSTGFTVDGLGNIASGGNLIISTTAPTINSHFNTSGDSITAVSTNAFAVTTGTGTGTSTGSLTMPTAANGWACSVADTTNGSTNMVQQTGTGTTSVTVTNFVRTTGVAGNFHNSDVLVFHCGAY